MAEKQNDDAWIVRPNGGLTAQIADNIWWAWGSLPGMSLRRTMTVVRRDDGGLIIHNAISLDEGGMKDLLELGEPKFVIVPNAGHRLDAPAWRKRFPAAKFLGPRGGRAQIEKKVALDGTYEDFPAGRDVRFEMIDGVAEAEGAMIVRSPDGITLVLNDVVFNMDRKRDPLGFLFTTVLGSAPGPRVSRLVKLLFVKDKKRCARTSSASRSSPSWCAWSWRTKKLRTGPMPPRRCAGPRPISNIFWNSSPSADVQPKYEGIASAWAGRERAVRDLALPPRAGRLAARGGEKVR